MRVIVTGGSGFIGSAVVRILLQKRGYEVLNIDKLTYAGNPASLKEVENLDGYQFRKLDICNQQAMTDVFESFKPDCIIHLAAESHVDRSIEGPEAFVTTNVLGTTTLLQVSLNYYNSAPADVKQRFRFHHVSTDEVYGSLGDVGLFTEETPYDPSSPYSASKAASDHFVRAWKETFDLPVTLSNCSNNYGPYQFPEKLIPLMIINCLQGKQLPIYGSGRNVRDWLFVDDHVEGILAILDKGEIGHTYNIGGNEERENIQVVNAICSILNDRRPLESGSYEDLITFVTDRPGHDKRYAIDATKINKTLGWSPSVTFETGLEKTIDWYLNNNAWWKAILSGEYLS